MKIPKTNPTPEQVRAARDKSGLTQREASLIVFGADSPRGFQNWETGARQAPLGQWVLFLLMTGQATLEDAQDAAIKRVEEADRAR